MKAILAIDTAGETAGVAVAGDGRVLAALTEASASRHAERLLDLVDAGLAAAGVSRADLGAVAVTTGPGSFTGLRVGIATVKGIAFALGLPAVAVSTLEAMARGAQPFPGLVVPLLDARKRQVYAAVFDGLTGAPVLEVGAREPGALAEDLASRETACLFLGSGLRPYGERFAQALGARCLRAPETRWPVPPAEVAALGWCGWEGGTAVDAARLQPVYHRLSEAEAARLRKG